MGDVAGVDDAAEFGALRAALRDCGVNAGQQAEVWRVLSAVLLLGEVDVRGDEEAQLPGSCACAPASRCRAPQPPRSRAFCAVYCVCVCVYCVHACVCVLLRGVQRRGRLRRRTRRWRSCWA